MKKALLINGSPNEHGCTDAALQELAASLTANGVEAEILWLGKKPMPDCIACGQCEGVCPQHLPIIELMQKVSAHFDR